LAVSALTDFNLTVQSLEMGPYDFKCPSQGRHQCPEPFLPTAGPHPKAPLTQQTPEYFQPLVMAEPPTAGTTPNERESATASGYCHYTTNHSHSGLSQYACEADPLRSWGGSSCPVLLSKVHRAVLVKVNSRHSAHHLVTARVNGVMIYEAHPVALRQRQQ
jgi:hypothetical protein